MVSVLRISCEKESIHTDRTGKNQDVNDNAPNGIRIHVDSLKGCCPRPLDDGGVINSVYQMHLCRHKLYLPLKLSMSMLEYKQ